MNNILFKLNIIYINLDYRKEKKERIENNLKKHKLNFERFNAIDGNKLEELDFFHRITKNKAKRGHYGCYLSHKKCYENFLKTNYDYLLILEDDILFLNDNTKEQLNFYINHLEKINKEKNIVDFLYLNRSPVTKTFKGYNIPNPEKYEDEYIYSPKIYGYGFHSYIITKKGAQKFLEVLKYNELLQHKNNLFVSIDNLDILMNDVEYHKKCDKLNIYTLKNDDIISVHSTISDTAGII